MKFILASGSPRRKEILDTVNLQYDVIVSDIEEKVHDHEGPKTVAAALAFEKAFDVSKQVDRGYIIAADTIVYLDHIYGKPQHDEDAFNMLNALKNKSHYVYTGICIIEAGTLNKIVDVVMTKVTMKDYSEEKIRRYIASGEPMGKAGAYAIQGYGSTLVKHIEGDYLNVVGLPISRLEDLFKKHFDVEFL